MPFNNATLIRGKKKEKQLALLSTWEKYYLDYIIDRLSIDQGWGMHADISIPNTLHERWTVQYIFHARSL